MREAGMEFYENRPRQPFIGFVRLGRALKRWWLRKRACQALRRMSDEQLKGYRVGKEGCGIVDLFKRAIVVKRIL